MESPLNSAWRELFSGSSTIVGDGAMGTMLQAAGLAISDLPDRWNLDHPEEICRTHAAYARVGARWLQTNSFGANRSRLGSAGLERQVSEINRASVHYCRQEAAAAAVLGTIGPTGASEAHSWEGIYAEQAAALAGAGTDGFVVETIVRLEEGVAAVRAAVAMGTGPVLASFTPGPDSGLLDGTTPETAAETFFRAGAAVVGVNCGSGPESLLEPARRLVRTGLGPVLAAPSAGLPRLVGGRATYRLTPDGFARSAIQFRTRGSA